MSSVLLDTNVLVRGMTGVAVPRKVRRILEDSNSELYVSIVSFWEIVNKPKLGLRVVDIERAIEGVGALLLPIRPAHLAELERLSRFENHRDPFDRLLIAQALTENVSILSSDKRFPQYRGLKVLWD